MVHLDDGQDRKDGVADAEGQRENTERNKYPQGAENRHDPQQDQKELDAVPRETNLRASDSGIGIGGLERDVVSRPHERQGRRRRSREAVGEHVDELEKVGTPSGAEAAREIGDCLTCKVGGQPGQEPVPKTSTERCLCGVYPGADDQVVLAESSHQPWG